MRDPGFGEALNAILRTVAFLTGTQAKLKMVEETVDGTKLVGYRFPEDGALPGDTQNLRFNASPCFAVVGDQFLAASTIELGREMIGVLKKSPPSAAKPNSTFRPEPSLCRRRRRIGEDFRRSTVDADGVRASRQRR